jgi:ribosomal protein L35AE/L33A
MKLATSRPLYPRECTQYMIRARNCLHPYKYGFFDHSKVCFDKREHGIYEPCLVKVYKVDVVSAEGRNGCVETLKTGQKSGFCKICRETHMVRR